MKKLTSALKEFEHRNNISVFATINSDGSCGLEEFWHEENLGSFNCIEELIRFLKSTQYSQDEKGLCYRPCTVKA